MSSSKRGLLAHTVCLAIDLRRETLDPRVIVDVDLIDSHSK